MQEIFVWMTSKQRTKANMEKIAISLDDVDKLNIIHVTGTKGAEQKSKNCLLKTIGEDAPVLLEEFHLTDQMRSAMCELVQTVVNNRMGTKKECNFDIALFPRYEINPENVIFPDLDDTLPKTFVDIWRNLSEEWG
ncbi:hypothetical protein KUTeg_008558 [Tegillarca granosa]|uniref:Uncharacterized protein n=1 Tax=Tegillarca granosa TaxID=220873 RepID=A0ABQ9FC47_TEGGR|nr:hypothetical protein KUTeg_008558 [Tegillarca granosa]